MHLITAPQADIFYDDSYIKCFLAGGITNCKNWQDAVISYLSEKDTPNLVLFNPRQENFDITNPNASREQIIWEFNALSKMDMFSMYFAKSESVQPICFYELGRYLLQMQHRFVLDYTKRIIVSIEDGFSRSNDVIIQTELATGSDYLVHYLVHSVNSPKSHAELIYYKYKFLLNNVKD